MEFDLIQLFLLFVAYALSNSVEFHFQIVDWVSLFFFVGILLLGSKDEKRCKCCGQNIVCKLFLLTWSGSGHAKDLELENQVERSVCYYELVVSGLLYRLIFFFDFVDCPPLALEPFIPPQSILMSQSYVVMRLLWS